MTPREAEKLLGGYATGTLTEAERRALFAAALEDQPLFDALADEESLRALLADPAHRARLLAALGKPAVPLWRRPATLGLAASLLVAVGAGVLANRMSAPAPRAPAAVEEAKPAAPREAPRTATGAPPAGTPPHRARRAPAPPAPQAAPPPPPPPMAAAEPGHAEAGAVADSAQGARGQVDVTGGQTAAGVNALGGPPSKAEARPKVSARYLAPAPAAEPPVSWQVESAPAGRVQIQVQAPAGGYLYLLRRAAAGTTVLAAARSTPRPGGGTIRLFTLALDPGDALDLYWMDAPPPVPGALPAQGPVAGFRARIWPEKRP